MKARGFKLLAAIAMTLVSIPARAQLAGTLVKGSAGLGAGSQAPAGVLVTPYIYWNHINGATGPNGNSLNVTGSIDSLAAPGLTIGYVSPFKILGAHYGAQLSLWMTSGYQDFPRVNQSSSGYGFGDMGVMPVQLGWHLKPGSLINKLDFVTAFQLWIPTGSYSVGGNSNNGQGQWGYEFQLGSTAFLGKNVNLATMFFYDIYSPKTASVTFPNGNKFTPQTGNTVTLMGGLGYSFLGGGLNVGIPYFVQWKVTQDTLPSSPTTLGILNNLAAKKAFSVGLGAEADLYWSETDGVQFRWVQAFDGHSTSEGPIFFFIYSHLIKPRKR